MNKILFKTTKNISGTNFPPELYDGHLFGKESYYDELRKQQQVEMDKFTKVKHCTGEEWKCHFFSNQIGIIQMDIQTFW